MDQKIFSHCIVDEKELTSNDVKQMQKEMFRLKEENEILKKAMTICARK